MTSRVAFVGYRAGESSKVPKSHVTLRLCSTPKESAKFNELAACVNGVKRVKNLRQLLIERSLHLHQRKNHQDLGGQRRKPP